MFNLRQNVSTPVEERRYSNSYVIGHISLKRFWDGSEVYLVLGARFLKKQDLGNPLADRTTYISGRLVLGFGTLQLVPQPSDSIVLSE